MPNEESAGPGATAKILVPPTSSFREGDVCLFVAYCPDGRIGLGLQFFLKKIIEQDIKAVLCVVVENEAVTVNVADLTMCSSIVVRKNTGYDFGAWAGTLRTLPQLWEAKRLFFVNDSILGPNENFGSLIAKIRASSEDFIALTANWIDVYHAASYFFVYQNDALKNVEIKEYWRNLPDFPSKVDVIRNCEQYQLGLFKSENLSSKIMFLMSEVLAQLSDSKRQKFNPTHDAWRNLLNEGFPFIKADLFYRSGKDLTGWGQYFQKSAVLEQIGEILQSRLFETSRNVRKNHSSLFVIKFIIGEDRFFELRWKWKKWKTMRKASEMCFFGCKQHSSREAGVKR